MSISWLAKIIITIVLVLSGLYFYSYTGANIPFVLSWQQSDLMMVSGEGKITVVPDTGLVNVGVTATSPKVVDSQTKVNKIVGAIIDALKNIEIDEKDIKTVSYNISPSYDWNKSRRLIGYEVSVELSVTVRSLNMVDDVIDTATEKGATNISNVRLIVDDTKLTAFQAAARKLAVNNARTKAEELAQAAGVSLGRLVKVQEGDTKRLHPYLEGSRLYREDKAQVATPIAAGTNDVTSKVTLFYATRH